MAGTGRILERWVLLALFREWLTRADVRADVKACGADELRCVLLDLTMPGMDGVEVLESLRQQSQDLSVIMMSGHAEESVRNRVSAGGHVADEPEVLGPPLQPGGGAGRFPCRCGS